MSANETSKFGGGVKRNVERGVGFSVLFATFQPSFWKLFLASLTL